MFLRGTCVALVVFVIRKHETARTFGPRFAFPADLLNSKPKGCGATPNKSCGTANLQNSQPSASNQSGDLIHRLIESQQQLTAVERFSQRHESITSPSLQPQYRDLIPLEAPGVDDCGGMSVCWLVVPINSRLLNTLPQRVIIAWSQRVCMVVQLMRTKKIH